MEIKLDNDKINESLSIAVTKAVSDSINSYDVKQLIQDHVTNSIVNVAIEATIKKAFIETDTLSLTKAIIKEIEKAVVSLAVNAIKEAMCGVVYQFRKPNGYVSEAEKDKILEKIKYELK